MWAATAVVAPPARATSAEALDCYSRDIGRRIEGCTKLLGVPGLGERERASAFAMRALALSLLGRYRDAITDYDRALQIDPNMPVALNNRAWASYRAGDLAAAWPDVKRSLALDPWSPHAFDTRAHLHHAEGNASAALADYKLAMKLGGAEMVKLYQCGLQAAGHYRGPQDGLVNDELISGLKACTADKKCDPLPPDEECKVAMS
ncbi:MAG: tetratricopeptide repeat protein [Pseudomonadota bacterium]